MIRHYSKTRLKIKARVKAKIKGTHSRPRLSVFRSNKYINVQLIDDNKANTLLGVSEKLTKIDGKTPTARAKSLGKFIATVAKDKKISRIVFDRNGYAYQGRIKALAEGLREGGLIF